jgi:hypothetical protein
LGAPKEKRIILFAAHRDDMSSPTDEFVIRGVTLAGRPFRPSDWAERLCGVMSAFGSDGRMQYSPYVYPVSSDGVKCVVVDVRLKEIEPMAYNFLLNFAKDNELEVRRGRAEARPEG